MAGSSEAECHQSRGGDDASCWGQEGAGLVLSARVGAASPRLKAGAQPQQWCNACNVSPKLRCCGTASAQPPTLSSVSLCRSNGFEQQRFARIANKKAVQELAYKWSVEDM